MICGTQEKPFPKFKHKFKASKICDRTKLLSLRRPTPSSKIRNSIPRPAYRPIENSLPLWETRELNEKIPMYHGYGPKGPLVLHRGLMGVNPLKDADLKLNFLLSDPYCHDTPYTYHPLHDPHLKHWMYSTNNRKFLQKQGLINENSEVVCNLKEYNEYRRFLWRIHNDSAIRLIKYNEQQKIDQRKISVANFNHRKDIEKKLKHLSYVMSNKKPQSMSNNKKKIQQKFEHVDKPLKKLPLKPKKIETYTVYGLNKSGQTDYNKYQGTYIKGCPDEFHLLGFFKQFFSNNDIN